MLYSLFAKSFIVSLVTVLQLCSQFCKRNAVYVLYVFKFLDTVHICIAFYMYCTIAQNVLACNDMYLHWKTQCCDMKESCLTNFIAYFKIVHVWEYAGRYMQCINFQLEIVIIA